MEIAVVTLLALAILFAVLYYLLPHYQAQSHGEESSVRTEDGASRIAALRRDHSYLEY